jgi:superfamily II DNA or RNA helicase
MLVSVSDWAWLPKDEIPLDKLIALKSKLTLTPRRTSVHQITLEPVELFRERDDKIGIPRAFFERNKKEHHDVKDETSGGMKILVPFEGEFTEDQKKAISTLSLTMERQQGGILQALPGWGKTVVAIGVWVESGVNAIVVVQKEYLLNQWIKRIKQFTPKARIGIIQKDSCQFGSSYDISIATIQSLVARENDYPKELWSNFGLVVLDEIHRVAAPGWSKVAPKFTACFRLGLTATPRRLDRMDNVFFWHIGPVVYKSEVKQVTPKLRRVFTNFEFTRTPTFDPSRLTKQIQLRFVCKNPNRNDLIVSELQKAVAAGRKVMVLSERRKHLLILKEKFDLVKPNECVVDFYIGGMPQEALDKAEGADVLFCTYQMTKEALDIPALDTIFLTTPIGDVEQAVGRIMRQCEDKKPAVITDFVDKNVKSFMKLWEMRRNFYIKAEMFKEGQT